MIVSPAPSAMLGLEVPKKVLYAPYLRLETQYLMVQI
jgi:hypothetical protein